MQEAKKIKFRLNKEFQAKYMKMRGWSVNDLADLLKYKKQQVSQTLSGAIEPSTQFLHRLCALTRLPVEELLETVFEK